MKIKHAMLALAIAAMATSASAFEFHGYQRAPGFGINSKGGGLTCFSLPNMDYKFRLGNECEAYGELDFQETLYKDKNGVEFKGEWMLAVNGTPFNQDYEAAEIASRQAWVGAKLPQLGNATIWAGKRYFHRNDVHMIDFFYFDPSGAGAGIEDVDLGFGKLAFTVFENGTNNSGNAVVRPEIRIYGVPLWTNGQLELAASLGFAMDRTDAGNVTKPADWVDGDGKTRSRASMSPWLTAQFLQTNLWGGFNKLAVQYATGLLASMNGYTSGSASNDAYQFRVVEHLQVQPVPEFSAEVVGVFQQKKYVYEGPTYAGQSFQSWSVGARPVYHVNDYFKLQAEIGYQDVKQLGVYGAADGKDLTLIKGTIAPTLVAGGNFWARPELRLFLTYASWNDDAKGQVGGAPFQAESSGLTFGAQLEAWW